jgi:mannosylglucosylglycerate synthase
MACRPRLVVTGPPDPHSDTSLAYYNSLLELRSRLGLDQELRFVYETGTGGAESLIIEKSVVSDFLRVSDVLFMPSHREGFGMPVLEAGLIGVPVVASNNVPAAIEIGGKNVYLFDHHASAEQIARIILDEVADSRGVRLRRLVRQNFTWESIFHRKIEPQLLGE